MAYRINGTDPFLRALIGAFNGYAMRNGTAPHSGATLLKRNATGGWQGLHTIDNGSGTDWLFPTEMNPSNQAAFDTTTSGWATTTAFTNTTDFMIIAYSWTGGTTLGDFTWRWKVGTGAWSSEQETAVVENGAPTTAGSGYRHIIGNVGSLSDDANIDWVCTGLIKSALTQGQIESLTMSSIASWDAVFTGAGAWLLDGQAIGTRTDRTGNGGNEVSRSGGITLVSDPAGFSWGGAASSLIVPKRAHQGLIMG